MEALIGKLPPVEDTEAEAQFLLMMPANPLLSGSKLSVSAQNAASTRLRLILGWLKDLPTARSQLDCGFRWDSEDSRTLGCLSSLLPEGHIHISTNSCSPPQLDGSVSISDKCVLGAAAPPAAYLFLVASLQELQHNLDMASCDHRRWYPFVSTVVMVCSVVRPQLRAQIALSFFKLLWKHSVYNSALFFDEYSIYRADPFDKRNNCGREMAQTKLSNCSYYRNPELTKFPNCEFHVSARESFPFSFMRRGAYIGSDVKLARFIAASSGLRIRWSSRPSPQSGSTGRQAHAYYGNLSRNEIDLAIGGSVMSFKFSFNVSYGFSHATQYLLFYVTDGVELRGWRRLVGMFSISLWLFILISMGVSALALYIFGRKSPLDYFLIVFGIMLEEPVRLPLGKLRFLLLSVILPFYWLSATYTTYLHSFTMNPPIYCEINSVSDVIKKNVTVMLSDTNNVISSKIDVKQVRKTLANTMDSPGLEESARMLNEKRDFVLLERDMAMTYLIKKNGYSIHSLPYKVTKLKISLVFAKGSVFRNRIESIIMRCVESGLCDKWIEDVLGTVYKEGPSLNTRPIIMADIDSAFTILGVGLTIASITLIVEIVINKITNPLRRKCNTWSFDIIWDDIFIRNNVSNSIK